MFESPLGVLGFQNVFRLGHPADDDRDARIDHQHLEPLRGLGHDLGPLHVEEVMEFVHDDQFHAAVFEQSCRAVGERLHRAAGPGRITQRQEQICGDAFGPNVGL